MLFNKPRAVEYMNRYGLDALVATSTVNVTYFTDYYCWMDPIFKEYMHQPGAPNQLFETYALFPLEGEPALIIQPLLAVNAVDVWVKDIYVSGATELDLTLPAGPVTNELERVNAAFKKSEGNATPLEALLSAIKDRGLINGSIGIEFENVPEERRNKIATALSGATVRDCTNLIRLLRAVKSPDEITLLKTAAEISEKAGMESFDLARPGTSLSELIQHFRVRIAEMGADFDHYAFGYRGYGLATEPEYILSDDDVMFTDWGVIYKGYFSDTGTTLAMCEPSDELIKRHGALRDSLISAAELMKPGVKSSIAQDAMWEPLLAGGITVCYPHGHGFGLDVRDYPIVVPDNGLRISDECVDVSSDLEFEPNMVINLEAGTMIAGVASLQAEQTYIVTPTGAELLIPQDRDKPLQPGK